MPLKASQIQMSDTFQPSTAYPTGVEGNGKFPLPSPRTQETAATRSRSTSSRLAFRNATPEHVLARHRRCYDASTVADHESPASGAVGYASSSGVDSSLTRKGRKVCRINEPVPPGHSCRLKQKKEKAPFVDVVSSPKCSYLSETSPRAPSSPCSDRPLRSLASKKSEVQDCADFQAHKGRKKRRRRASAASEAARKSKDVALSVPYPPRNAGPAETETSKAKTARSCVLSCFKDVAMRASQRCVHSSK